MRGKPGAARAAPCLCRGGFRFGLLFRQRSKRSDSPPPLGHMQLNTAYSLSRFMVIASSALRAQPVVDYGSWSIASRPVFRRAPSSDDTHRGRAADGSIHRPEYRVFVRLIQNRTHRPGECAGHASAFRGHVSEYDQPTLSRPARSRGRPAIRRPEPTRPRSRRQPAAPALSPSRARRAGWPRLDRPPLGRPCADLRPSDRLTARGSALKSALPEGGPRCLAQKKRPRRTGVF